MAITTKILMQQLLTVDPSEVSVSKTPRYTVSLGNSISSITAGELTDAVNKASNSATAAKASETNAKASQTAALASQNAAKTSETSAKASETAAANAAAAAANKVDKGGDSMTGDLFTPTLKSTYMKANGSSNFLPDSQGAWVSWNRESGSGAFELINHRGNGTGGFNFWNGTNSALNKLAYLSAQGNLGVSSNLILGSLSSNTYINFGGYNNSTVDTVARIRTNIDGTMVISTNSNIGDGKAIYFRPNGDAVATGQLFIANSGDLFLSSGNAIKSGYRTLVTTDTAGTRVGVGDTSATNLTLYAKTPTDLRIETPSQAGQVYSTLNKPTSSDVGLSNLSNYPQAPRIRLPLIAGGPTYCRIARMSQPGSADGTFTFLITGVNNFGGNGGVSAVYVSISSRGYTGTINTSFVNSSVRGTNLTFGSTQFEIGLVPIDNNVFEIWLMGKNYIRPSIVILHQSEGRVNLSTDDSGNFSIQSAMPTGYTPSTNIETSFTTMNKPTPEDIGVIPRAQGGSGTDSGAQSNYPGDTTVYSDWSAAAEKIKDGNYAGSFWIAGTWASFLTATHRSGTGDGLSYQFAVTDNTMVAANYNGVMLRKKVQGNWIDPVNLWHTGNLANPVQVGNYGLGASSPPTISDYDTMTTNGWFRSAAGASNAPASQAPFAGFSYGYDGASRLQLATAMGGKDYKIYFRQRSPGGPNYWGDWHSIWTTANTTVDANGFVKRASPIMRLADTPTSVVDLFADAGFHAAGIAACNAEATGAIASKIGVGTYLVSGSKGLSKEGWTVEIPQDFNGNRLCFVSIETLPDSDDFIVHTSSRKFDMNTASIVAGDPLDIPEGRWIDLRLEM